MRRLTAADFAVILAALILIGVAAAPALRARSFRSMTNRAIGRVEAVRTAALGQKRENGSWPVASPVGASPPQLAALFPGDSALVFPGFSLEWQTLGVVEYVERPMAQRPIARPGDAPPDSVAPELIPSVRPLGRLVLHTGDDALLGELLARYGTESSFVLDSTWNLVIDDLRGDSIP